SCCSAASWSSSALSSPARSAAPGVVGSRASSSAWISSTRRRKATMSIDSETSPRRGGASLGLAGEGSAAWFIGGAVWWGVIRVDGGAVGSGEDPGAVGAGHGDSAGVDECVVVVAEQCAVGGVGGSAVGPVDAGVVGFADGRWGGAAGPGAALVPGDQGAALGGGEQSVGADAVDDLVLAVDKDAIEYPAEDEPAQEHCWDGHVAV